MNWKEFKNKFNSDKTMLDESKFIVGIDIGNSTSSISYFDLNRNEPELIDISGGYGKASIPTIVQYIKDTKEWVFGEYALLNKGFADEITFDNLVSSLGKKIYYEIDDKPISLTYILSLYVKEVISNIKNLNPNAEIAGIISSVPSYMSDEAKEEFYNVFKMAGFEKELIKFISDRECMLQNYCFYKEFVNEKVLLIDFGSREVRAGIYEINKNDNKITAESISSLFNKEIGVQVIENEVNELFTFYYCENKGTKNISSQLKYQIEGFAYQHKDLFFQKLNNKKIKLYFNFAYPPFQKTVTDDDINALTLPFVNKMEAFLNNVFDKTLNPKEQLTSLDIDTVLCSGGGFEMLWIRNLLEKNFPSSNIKIYKNSKGVISNGASIYAASVLGICGQNTMDIKDKHQLYNDIGFKINDGNTEKFIPIIEKNSFWWQNFENKMFIVNQSTDKPFKLELFKRDSNGELLLINEIKISNMPKRPKGTTKISVSMEYKNYNQLIATIKDEGFGEIFPKSDYSERFLIDI